jgi:UDP-N-acetylglucosamine:LPS N-acetylglucosamine transferase
MKILIFYSSVGDGHISAAHAVERRILQKDPTSTVVLKNIRDFMNPSWRALDERLYWFIAANLPRSFDALFASFSRKGARAPSISSLPCDCPVERVVEFLEAEAPDTIISTYYGAAQLLGGLRERGLLRREAIGWVHTDYFESYFPRISNRIDRTFVAHRDIARRWIEAGVPKDKVVATGMPVDVPDIDRGDLRHELTKLGLAEDVLTILIVNGRTGVGNYRVMIESLVASAPKPIQIIAVCGTNAARRAQLAAQAANLPSTVSLTPLGLVPHEDLVKLIGASDLLVTKPGGLTPSEAFAVGTPTIVLDVISGHERENSQVFARCGLAKVSRSPASLGQDVYALMRNGPALARMRDVQTDYRHNMALNRIVDFALEKRAAAENAPIDFGREYGASAMDVDVILEQIDREVPADLELLLSYATARTPQRVVVENPFGHIAIRIGPTTYSANHIAHADKDPKILQHISLADFLYGTNPPSLSQEHTSTYGMAYGREVLALRVTGVAPSRSTAMLGEIANIEDEYRRGDLVWDRRFLNCADLVARILAAGGWRVCALDHRMRLPSMPLDVFEAAADKFASDPELSTRLIAYRQMPGTKADYRYSRFPLSLSQPMRSLSSALQTAREDPLEAQVTRQVTALVEDRRLFEDILVEGSERSGAEGMANSVERAMLADLWRLLRIHVADPALGASTLGITGNGITGTGYSILQRPRIGWRAKPWPRADAAENCRAGR